MATLKEIQGGQGNFVKDTINLGETTINDTKLKFTFADKTDLTTRAFGNLFSSFNFPITVDDINDFKSTTNGTFLKALNVDKVIVAEIPQNEYGELIDGKTMEFKFPIIDGTGTTEVSCYSSFINRNDDTDYDSLVSEGASVGHNFNVAPYPLVNDNNSNMVFLFSDNIQEPTDNGTSIETSLFNSSVDSAFNIGASLLNEDVVEDVDADTDYRVKITNLTITASTEGLIELLADIGDVNFAIIANNQVVSEFFIPETIDTSLTSNQTSFSIDDIDLDFKLLTSASTFTIRFETDGGDGLKLGNVSFDYSYNSLNFTYTKTWDKWTRTNKFASPTGKVLANLQTDVAIGVAYLDKGFIVITHPDLVDNFNSAGAVSSGFNSIADGDPYTGPSDEFTQIYFTGTTDANLTYKSIKTEFIQSIDCFALPNEFYQTNNPTYGEAYGSVNEDPLYITEVGLYNGKFELIAIAKLSKPISKSKNNIRTFNVKLKL